MKGIVFSFKKSPSFKRRKRGASSLDLSYIIKRYGISFVFVFLLLLGLTLGAIYAHKSDSELLKSLDFLFTTNLEARLAKGALGIFCACFASDFIFLLTVYLLGLAPWGLPFELFAVMFKGFGTGLTAAYLLIINGLSGVGFYLLVLLPGTFLFCLALVSFSSYAFDFSKKMFLNVIGKNDFEQSSRERTIRYSSQFLSAMIMTFCAALLDTVLWTLFAGAFNF